MSNRQAANRKGDFNRKVSAVKISIEKKKKNVSRRALYRNLRNFPKSAVVINWIINTGRNYTVWDNLYEAKDAFSAIRMVEMGTLDLKKNVVRGGSQ